MTKACIASTGESGYVLKQLRASKDTPEQLRLSFSREAYFGQLINRLTSSLGACNLQDSLSCLDGKQHLVRYIESFEVIFSCLSHCKVYPRAVSSLPIANFDRRHLKRTVSNIIVTCRHDSLVHSILNISSYNAFSCCLPCLGAPQLQPSFF